MNAGPLKRRIEINNHEFTVFGRAPWIVVPVKATDKTPECVIIIEAHMMTYVFGASITPINPHRYNALSKVGRLGALLPVAFTGADGKVRAEEICKILNWKLDK